MSRRTKRLALAVLAALLVAAAIVFPAKRTGADPVAMTVYLTRACGCCGEWVAYMKRNGFMVTTRYMAADELAGLKDHYGVPPAARSCHVAEVRGYAVEGHTPADVVRRLLADRPALAGIAVPGMPAGSPGMEIRGRRPDSYHVVGFDGEGDLTLLESR